MTTEFDVFRAVNLLDFAALGRQEAGVVDIERLARLSGSVLPSVRGLPDGSELGSVKWSIQGVAAGGFSATGALLRDRIVVAVQAELAQVCQRCLAPVVVRVKSRREIELAQSEIQADQWAMESDDDLDAVSAADPIVPADLIEDEVLLCLPFAAMHEVCEESRSSKASGLGVRELGVTEPALPSEPKVQAFAGLRELLGRSTPKK